MSAAEAEFLAAQTSTQAPATPIAPPTPGTPATPAAPPVAAPQGRRAGGGALPPLVICAPNAFKGTLSANAAAHALVRGAGDAGWRGLPVAVADGGDGTLDVLLAGSPGGRVQRVRVTGPGGRPRWARLGWIGPGVAVVEMAEASGLRLLGQRRDPMGASSAGVGPRRSAEEPAATMPTTAAARVAAKASG